ncbi:MAG TPA: beta-ketoacyl-[acyl-carrier-protein] synthase family protein [Candidatus Eisenbacteria bacterium]|nr:beta-ketoacyl-[acyl-carrier-protein] synthase family protein [Candidatus Eisenbacteria bacterium]
MKTRAGNRPRVEASVPPNGRLFRRRVVVTGIGVVSPNGIGAEAFGVALRNGTSGIGTITFFDPTGLDCRVAGEARAFEPEKLFPAKDLRRMGRSAHMAIAAADEAFRSAGLNPQIMTLEERRSWGVVLGSGGGAPDFIELQYRLYFNDQLRKVSAYNISSSTIGALSSEVSLFFNLRGPSHVVSTGCTSSTDAIGYAFNMIRFGLADRFVTGGVDAPITAGVMQGFCVMKAVSTGYNDEPQRASRPFDRLRDGFVLGEGAWILLLEEREQALERGAPVRAEILGYASTCDAYHRVRLEPSGEESARAMTLALQDARIAKEDVGYIALHGTSTVLNDATETRAIKLCFGRRAYGLPMSSVKSMIGHPQGASGAAGAVAAILGMNAGFLPPTINYEQADDACDLDYLPDGAAGVATEVSLCNCIGFGSKNSALVIARGETR